MLNIDVDVSSFTLWANELQEKQIPFATMKALNAVTVDVQVAERARLREVFTIRREQWADRSIKITHFATKTEQFTTLAIAPPGDRGDIFGKFEDDTEKRAQGAHGVAVPIDAKRTKADIVQNKQRPKNLHLHREGNRVVGDDGTYIVHLADGRELLVQRKDLGKRAAAKAGRGTAERGTLLFIFVPVVRIIPDLHYYLTAVPVVEQQWPVRFSEAFDQAMATAR